MKKLAILLMVAMFGLVLACGAPEEKKPPAAKAEKAEKVAPAPAAPAPAPAAPAPAPAPPAPAPEKPAPPAAK